MLSPLQNDLRNLRRQQLPTPQLDVGSAKYFSEDSGLEGKMVGGGAVET
jgi:hypothetical protein